MMATINSFTDQFGGVGTTSRKANGFSTVIRTAIPLPAAAGVRVSFDQSPPLGNRLINMGSMYC